MEQRAKCVQLKFSDEMGLDTCKSCPANSTAPEGSTKLAHCKCQFGDLHDGACSCDKHQTLRDGNCILCSCTCNAPSKASQLQPRSPRLATLGWNPKPRRLASVSLQTRRNVVLAVMTAVRATTELFAQAALTDFGPSRADASPVRKLARPAFGSWHCWEV